VAGGNGSVQFAAQVAGKASNGFTAIANPVNFFYNPDPDGYSNRSASASLGLTLAPGQELSAQYLRSRLDNQIDGSFEHSFDDRTITVVQTWQVASRNTIAPFWVSRLSAGEGLDDSQTDTADGSFPFKTTQRQYAWQNDFAVPLGTLIAGYERREENLATDAAFATTARTTDSLFGIYQLRLDAHALQANLRRDDSSQYGGKTTGAIAYGYRFSPALRITAGYSTGFKAPSFNDSIIRVSNPDLARDLAEFRQGAYWNGSLGVRHRGARYRLSQPDLGLDRGPV
jgi:vitamin B12 transporter